ncbi:cysteine synthase CysM [Rudanella paleaurantiibacter]|uniref:Cysteine synthase n=1 Tax=Rudanella paleaurantiibacter TaxID=2614655 RepID=A0A7J5U3P7_9BACT|nr:cysteine synthase CysM [Rudanella paleaurantiibacter]KAB7732258.1 cysteine synthase CysM [Rudanella paleaurantiibacter]
MASLLDLVGNTPLVELNRLTATPARPHRHVRLLGKLEGHNPGGSVKDRAAYSMIKGAIDRGELKPGTRLIEATSGNTGIALAMIARLFDVEIELAMPKNSTRERVLTMEAFGATVTLTETIESARDYAEEQVQKGGFLMLNQFANPDNYLAHYRTTGPEIWRDTNGEVTHFVSSMGTTGTIMGTSRYLKEQNPAIQIVGCQPTDGSSIPGIRKWPVEYLPQIFEPQRVDRIIEVSEADAVATTRRLAQEEGVFAGMSSGGAVWAALQLLEELDHGTVVCIICDRGDRYLSSGLFG